MRWTIEAKQKIDALIERARSGDDIICAFDADGTLWLDDIGESFLRELIADRALVGVDYDSDIYAHYEELCEKDTDIGYAYAVQLMAGLRETDVLSRAKRHYDACRSKVIPEMRDLVLRLVAAGARVFFVSASNRWIVSQATAEFGVGREQIYAMQTHVVDGRLTSEMIMPLTNRIGKRKTIEQIIQGRPHLVGGNSMGDFEMLEMASDMVLVINPSGELKRHCDERQWTVQLFN